MKKQMSAEGDVTAVEARIITLRMPESEAREVMQSLEDDHDEFRGSDTYYALKGLLAT